MSKLDNVHPVLIERVLTILALATAERQDVRPVQGLRTFAEQDKLFAQKHPVVTHARGGESYHNYGLAVDLGFFINGIYSDNDLLYHKIGAWAKTVNLEWGGDWHKKDLPHVQLPDMPNNAVHLLPIYKAKGIQGVWDSIKI